MPVDPLVPPPSKSALSLTLVEELLYDIGLPQFRGHITIRFPAPGELPPSSPVCNVSGYMHTVAEGEGTPSCCTSGQFLTTAVSWLRVHNTVMLYHDVLIDEGHISALPEKGVLNYHLEHIELSSVARTLILPYDGSGPHSCCSLWILDHTGLIGSPILPYLYPCMVAYTDVAGGNGCNLGIATMTTTLQAPRSTASTLRLLHAASTTTPSVGQEDASGRV